MSNILVKTSAVYDWVIRLTTIISGVLILFMVFSISADVVMRYFFHAPILWVDEIAGFMQLYIGFLVAAWVLKRDGHVKMDLVINRLNIKNRAILNAVTSLIGALVFLAIAWFSSLHTAYVFQLDHRTPTFMRFPLFTIMVAIPFGSLLLGIEFLIKSWSNLHVWRTLPNEQNEMVKTD
jgi:C4-dicarboxylate transporter DctQ subunit